MHQTFVFPAPTIGSKNVQLKREGICFCRAYIPHATLQNNTHRTKTKIWYVTSNYLYEPRSYLYHERE